MAVERWLTLLLMMCAFTRSLNDLEVLQLYEYETSIDNALPISQWIDLGLTGYYPLDGNAKDFSGNKKDGILSGASPTSGVNFMPSTAVYFDGVNDTVEVPYSLNTFGGDWALSFWFDLHSWGNGYVEFMSAGYAENTFYVGVTPTRNLRIGGGYNNLTEFHLGNPTGWHSLLLSKSNNNINVYYDGLHVSSGSSSVLLSDSSQGLFRIGNQYGNDPNGFSEHFNGSIDDRSL